MMKFDHPLERSPEKDCWSRLTFQHPHNVDGLLSGGSNVSCYQHFLSGLVSPQRSKSIETGYSNNNFISTGLIHATHSA